LPIFAIATALPFLLLTIAALHGGAAVWLALGYLTVFVALADRVFAAGMGNADPDAAFPAAPALLIVLGLGHVALLGLAVRTVAGQGTLGAVERIGMALSAGIVFGQISHPAAHELIHRPRRWLRLLGRAIYTTLLIGHHASAHLLVHHVHVATPADPSSAPRGTGFYRFAVRAWGGAFLAGLKAENRRRKRRRRPPWTHPYALYLGGGALTLVAAAALGGLAGVLALVIMALYAQVQILLSDYVQHYGLRRATGPDGRVEPVGPAHSWNAPQAASSALMLNAPRHSDHHGTPSRAYPALQLDRRTMPCLPRSLPVMAVLALLPPVWFRIMDPLAERWQGAEARDSG